MLPSVIPSHIRDAQRDGSFYAPRDGMHVLLEWGLLRPLAIPRHLVKTWTPTLFFLSLFDGAGIGSHGFMMGLLEGLGSRKSEIRLFFLFAAEGDMQTAQQAARSWFQSTGQEIVVSAANLDPTFAREYSQNPQFMQRLLLSHGYDKERDKIAFLTTPPCQNASGAGHRKDESDLDALSYTAGAYVELLDKLDIYVNVLVYENVPGLRTKWDGYENCFILTKIVWDLLRQKFAVRYSEDFHTANYGGNQDRRRLFLLAFRGVVMSRAPPFTHTAESGFNKLKLHDIVADKLFQRRDCLLLPFRGPKAEEVEAEFQETAAARLDTMYAKVIVPTEERFATELVPTSRATYPVFMHSAVLETCKAARNAVKEWPSLPCDKRTHDAYYSKIECVRGTNEDCMSKQWGRQRAYDFCRYLERGAPDGFLRTLTVDEFARTQGYDAALLNPALCLSQAYRMLANAIPREMARAFGRSVAEAVICTLARERGDKKHSCSACFPLVPRLRNIDLGSVKLVPYDEKRPAATSSPFRCIEGEDPIPAWLDHLRSNLDDDDAEEPPEAAYVIPRSYSYRF
ncbi:S-adenosyl-L-methionine-dependent methyltransferase [Hyaloraphidium curvatum]|nr:S-adenosyl-L-methionine-dependent methyltransferase [Hyaloraphidium curvatum]